MENVHYDVIRPHFFLSRRLSSIKTKYLIMKDKFEAISCFTLNTSLHLFFKELGVLKYVKPSSCVIENLN